MFFGFLFSVGIYAGLAAAGVPRAAAAVRVDSPRATILVHVLLPFMLVGQRLTRAAA
jgi:hypothetical protein